MPVRNSLDAENSFSACRICGKQHDPKVDPIKDLRGPALIDVDPEILVFHGKETIEVPRGHIAETDYGDVTRNTLLPQHPNPI